MNDNTINKENINCPKINIKDNLDNDKNRVKVFREEDYPPKKRILWLKRRKKIYFASSVLCTFVGVIYCKDIQEGECEEANNNLLSSTSDNEFEEIEEVNEPIDTEKITEVIIDESLSNPETDDEIEKAIEMVKDKLDEIEDDKAIQIDNEEEYLNEENDEYEEYYYNLDEKLKSSNKGQSIEVGQAVSSNSVTNAMRYWKYFEYYGYTYGVDPYLLVAIACQESGGDHFSTIDGGSRYKGAGYGIMQIEQPGVVTTKITAYNHTTNSYEVMNIDSKEDVKDVKMNIKAGAMIFAQRAKENQYNPYVTIQGYNYGQSGIKYAISYYIADGDMSTIEDIYKNGKGELLLSYISSTNEDWINEKTSTGLTAREWYTSVGWKKFGAGGGDKEYIEHVMRFYKGSYSPYIVKDSGIKVYF